MKLWMLTSWAKSCTPSRKTWCVAAYWQGEPRIDGREKDMIRGLDVRTWRTAAYSRFRSVYPW
ncbi:Polyribonucleotide nucleotidyl transferase [Salmonella enterica subsp. enterica]|uniref:Polyribonucleotide nucleotidyl transferase n=1 Tax=Salmonella enterica I TaxID=59201 RepID=A0A379VK13_SALET|nr:Polyribonucleotide nucleotidyl transferase [Salmonella enterica subsp. enterica]